nr:spectrin beta chain, non-erythrocytic 4-like [Columba livia]
MSEHQSLKSEMDARAKSVAACLELGKSLLLSQSPAADEIKAHVDKLLAKKKEMTEKWDKHWEWLQQSESHRCDVVLVLPPRGSDVPGAPTTGVGCSWWSHHGGGMFLVVEMGYSWWLGWDVLGGPTMGVGCS